MTDIGCPLGGRLKRNNRKGKVCVIRKEYMRTTNAKQMSLSPQTQVETPEHMSEEAGVPATETTMNMSGGRLGKNPHIHYTILKKL